MQGALHTYCQDYQLEQQQQFNIPREYKDFVEIKNRLITYTFPANRAISLEHLLHLRESQVIVVTVTQLIKIVSGVLEAQLKYSNGKFDPKQIWIVCKDKLFTKIAVKSFQFEIKLSSIHYQVKDNNMKDFFSELLNYIWKSIIETYKKQSTDDKNIKAYNTSIENIFKTLLKSNTDPPSLQKLIAQEELGQKQSIGKLTNPSAQDAAQYYKRVEQNNQKFINEINIIAKENYCKIELLNTRLQSYNAEYYLYSLKLEKDCLIGKFTKTIEIKDEEYFNCFPIFQPIRRQIQERITNICCSYSIFNVKANGQQLELIYKDIDKVYNDSPTLLLNHFRNSIISLNLKEIISYIATVDVITMQQKTKTTEFQIIPQNELNKQLKLINYQQLFDFEFNQYIQSIKPQAMSEEIFKVYIKEISETRESTLQIYIQSLTKALSDEFITNKIVQYQNTMKEQADEIAINLVMNFLPQSELIIQLQSQFELWSQYNKLMQNIPNELQAQMQGYWETNLRNELQITQNDKQKQLQQSFCSAWATIVFQNQFPTAFKQFAQELESAVLISQFKQQFSNNLQQKQQSVEHQILKEIKTYKYQEAVPTQQYINDIISQQITSGLQQLRNNFDTIFNHQPNYPSNCKYFTKHDIRIIVQNEGFNHSLHYQIFEQNNEKISTSLELIYKDGLLSKINEAEQHKSQIFTQFDNDYSKIKPQYDDLLTQVDQMVNQCSTDYMKEYQLTKDAQQIRNKLNSILKTLSYVKVNTNVNVAYLEQIQLKWEEQICKYKLLDTLEVDIIQQRYNQTILPIVGMIEQSQKIIAQNCSNERLIQGLNDQINTFIPQFNQDKQVQLFQNIKLICCFAQLQSNHIRKQLILIYTPECMTRYFDNLDFTAIYQEWQQNVELQEQLWDIEFQQMVEICTNQYANSVKEQVDQIYKNQIALSIRGFDTAIGQ